MLFNLQNLPFLVGVIAPDQRGGCDPNYVTTFDTVSNVESLVKFTESTLTGTEESVLSKDNFDDLVVYDHDNDATGTHADPVIYLPGTSTSNYPGTSFPTDLYYSTFHIISNSCCNQLYGSNEQVVFKIRQPDEYYLKKFIDDEFFENKIIHHWRLFYVKDINDISNVANIQEVEAATFDAVEPSKDLQINVAAKEITSFCGGGHFFVAGYSHRDCLVFVSNPAKWENNQSKCYCSCKCVKTGQNFHVPCNEVESDGTCNFVKYPECNIDCVGPKPPTISDCYYECYKGEWIQICPTPPPGKKTYLVESCGVVTGGLTRVVISDAKGILNGLTPKDLYGKVVELSHTPQGWSSKCATKILLSLVASSVNAEKLHSTCSSCTGAPPPPPPPPPAAAINPLKLQVSYLAGANTSRPFVLNYDNSKGSNWTHADFYYDIGNGWELMNTGSGSHGAMDVKYSDSGVDLRPFSSSVAGYSTKFKATCKNSALTPSSKDSNIVTLTGGTQPPTGNITLPAFSVYEVKGKKIECYFPGGSKFDKIEVLECSSDQSDGTIKVHEEDQNQGRRYLSSSSPPGTYCYSLKVTDTSTGNTGVVNCKCVTLGSGPTPPPPGQRTLILPEFEISADYKPWIDDGGYGNHARKCRGQIPRCYDGHYRDHQYLINFDFVSAGNGFESYEILEVNPYDFTKSKIANRNHHYNGNIPNYPFAQPTARLYGRNLFDKQFGSSYDLKKHVFAYTDSPRNLDLLHRLRQLGTHPTYNTYGWFWFPVPNPTPHRTTWSDCFDYGPTIDRSGQNPCSQKKLPNGTTGYCSNCCTGDLYWDVPHQLYDFNGQVSNCQQLDGKYCYKIKIRDNTGKVIESAVKCVTIQKGHKQCVGPKPKANEGCYYVCQNGQWTQNCVSPPSIDYSPRLEFWEGNSPGGTANKSCDWLNLRAHVANKYANPVTHASTRSWRIEYSSDGGNTFNEANFFYTRHFNPRSPRSFVGNPSNPNSLPSIGITQCASNSNASHCTRDVSFCTEAFGNPSTCGSNDLEASAATKLELGKQYIFRLKVYDIIQRPTPLNQITYKYSNWVTVDVTPCGNIRRKKCDCECPDGAIIKGKDCTNEVNSDGTCKKSVPCPQPPTWSSECGVSIFPPNLSVSFSSVNFTGRARLIGGGGNISGPYKLLQWDNVNNNWAHVGYHGGLNQSYNLSGLSPETTYYYMLEATHAINNVTHTCYSNVVSFTTPKSKTGCPDPKEKMTPMQFNTSVFFGSIGERGRTSTPAGIKFSIGKTSTVTNAGAGYEAGVRYQIEWTTNLEPSSWKYLIENNKNKDPIYSYFDDTIVPCIPGASEYYFRVRAVRTTNCGKQESLSNIVTFTNTQCKCDSSPNPIIPTVRKSYPRIGRLANNTNFWISDINNQDPQNPLGGATTIDTTVFLSDHAATCKNLINYFTVKVPDYVNSNNVTGYNHVTIQYDQVDIKKVYEGATNPQQGISCLPETGCLINSVIIKTGYNNEVTLPSSSNVDYTLDIFDHNNMPVFSFEVESQTSQKRRLLRGVRPQGIKQTYYQAKGEEYVFENYTGILECKDLGGYLWHSIKKTASDITQPFHCVGDGIDGIQSFLGGGPRGEFDVPTKWNTESPTKSELICITNDYASTLGYQGYFNTRPHIPSVSLGDTANSCPGSAKDLCWDITVAKSATVKIQHNFILDKCTPYPNSIITTKVRKHKANHNGPINDIIYLGILKYVNTGIGYYPEVLADTLYIQKSGDIDCNRQTSHPITPECHLTACPTCDNGFVSGTSNGISDVNNSDFYINPEISSASFAPGETGKIIFENTIDVYTSMDCNDGTAPVFSGTVVHHDSFDYYINHESKDKLCTNSCDLEQQELLSTDFIQYTLPNNFKEPDYYKFIIDNRDNLNEIKSNVVRYSKEKTNNNYLDFNYVAEAQNNLSLDTLFTTLSGNLTTGWNGNYDYIKNYPIDSNYFDYFVFTSKDSEHSNAIHRQIDLRGNLRNPREDWEKVIRTGYNDWYGTSGIIIDNLYENDFYQGEPYYSSILDSIPCCGEHIIQVDINDLGYSPVSLKIANKSETQIKATIAAGIHKEIFGVTTGDGGNESWKDFTKPELIQSLQTGAAYYSDKNPEYFIVQIIKDFTCSGVNGIHERGVEDFFVISEIPISEDIKTHIITGHAYKLTNVEHPRLKEVISSENFDVGMIFNYDEQEEFVKKVTAKFGNQCIPNFFGTPNSIFNLPIIPISDISFPATSGEHFRFKMNAGIIRNQESDIEPNIANGNGYAIRASLDWSVRSVGLSCPTQTPTATVFTLTPTITPTSIP